MLLGVAAEDCQSQVSQYQAQAQGQKHLTNRHQSDPTKQGYFGNPAEDADGEGAPNESKE